MADEAFALSPISARATLPSEADYDAIREAFMETARGRWFLTEYGKRNRNADTTMVLDAVARIEQAIAAQKQQPPVNALLDSLGAIRLLVLEAKDSTARRLADISDNDIIVTARDGARIVREIAWTLRECGADTRICDLLDSQVAAIDAGHRQIGAISNRDAILAPFELLIQRIAELAGSDGSSEDAETSSQMSAASPTSRVSGEPAATPTAFAEAAAQPAPSTEAAAEPALSAEAAAEPARAVQSHGVETTVPPAAPQAAVTPDVKPPQAVAAPLAEIAQPQPAAPSQAVEQPDAVEPAATEPPVFDMQSLDAALAELDEAPVLDAPLREPPAPEPQPEVPTSAFAADDVADVKLAGSEQDEIAEDVEAAAETTAAEDVAVLEIIAAEMAEPDQASIEIAPHQAEPTEASTPEPAFRHAAAAEQPMPPEVPAAPEAALVPELPASRNSANSLGEALLASGVVRKPTLPALDPLAPFRRMSQAERIAFFS